jgi:hypothetical protein
MKNIELSKHEITYLLISLRHFEDKLLSDESEEMEDTATDLIFIQSLIKKLKDTKDG